MDAKTKRKRINKKHKKRSTRSKKSVLATPRISRIVGVERLFLSPLTQKILDCRIGINITPTKPWIFIPKEKILENIELHENSSEFLPIKDAIEQYPEDRILVVCYGHVQHIAEEFLICVTLDSTHSTLHAIEAEEDKRRKLLCDFIERLCGAWLSLGSDEEVNENLPLTLRIPYQVHLTTEVANFHEKYKFSFRFVGDSPSGYMELLPKENFSNIFRKRVNCYAQCFNLKNSALTQTRLLSKVNKGTMTGFLKKPKKNSADGVNAFISRINHVYLFDILQTNYYMDLCRSDYAFKNASKIQILKIPSCVLTFQDIFSCRGQRVSSVSWNAMKSGLIAASYVKRPRQMIIPEEPTLDASNVMFEDHLILVWSYCNSMNPLLYLHCHREVTVLSFCSYNPNIIVAGCENGQIMVWDITGRLERSRGSKLLTRGQQENHLIIQAYMKWMQEPPQLQHVQPVLSSKFDFSPSSPINHIEWLPPDQIITKNGKFEKKKPNDKNMQFLASSNGAIEIWDVGAPKDIKIEGKKKRKVRLSKVPQALTRYVSPMKYLQPTFIPDFRIHISNPENRKPMAVCTLLAKQQSISYRPLNPETQNHLLKTTNYEHVIHENQNLWEQEVIFTTNFGEVCSMRWDGFDYDQGCLVNSNHGVISNLRCIHDGPVFVCMKNPIIQGLFLTIGGRVFAIWSTQDLRVPLFWRKAIHRYVAGSWLSTQPFQIGLERFDTFQEVWDLMEDSKEPMKVLKGSGRATDGVYNDFERIHAKKGTFVNTNIAGEIKVYSVIRDFIGIKKKEVDEVLDYLEDIQWQKEKVLIWTNKITKKILETQKRNKKASIQQEIPDDKQTLDTVSRNYTTILKPPQNTWQEKEEAFMKRILLAQKEIKMDQLIQNSEFLKQAEILREKHATRYAEQVQNVDQNMRNWKTLLLPEKMFIKKAKICVALPKSMYEVMKKSYFDDYRGVEKTTLYFIRTHPYHFFPRKASSDMKCRIPFVRKRIIELK